MFAVVVRLKAAAGSEDALWQAVLANACTSLDVEPGCRRFDAARDREAPGMVVLWELYDDRAAFDHHLASAHFRDFDRRSAPLTAEKTVETYDQAAPGGRLSEQGSAG